MHKHMSCYCLIEHVDRRIGGFGTGFITETKLKPRTETPVGIYAPYSQGTEGLFSLQLRELIIDNLPGHQLTIIVFSIGIQ